MVGVSGRRRAARPARRTAVRRMRMALGTLGCAGLAATLLTAVPAQALTPARATSTALPPFTCGSTSGGSSATLGHVRTVRVGHHTGYDRFTIEFTGTVLPHYA